MATKLSKVVTSLRGSYPLTHFMPVVSYDTPRKQKTSGFLMFSGSIERDQWHEMDQVILLFNQVVFPDYMAN